MAPYRNFPHSFFLSSVQTQGCRRVSVWEGWKDEGTTIISLVEQHTGELTCKGFSLFFLFFPMSTSFASIKGVQFGVLTFFCLCSRVLWAGLFLRIDGNLDNTPRLFFIPNKLDIHSTLLFILRKQRQSVHLVSVK